MCLSDPMDNGTCHSIEKVTKSQYYPYDRGIVADDSGERCEARTCVVNVFRSLLFEAITYLFALYKLL